MKILSKPDSTGFWWYRPSYHGQKFCTGWNIVEVNNIDKDGNVLCIGHGYKYNFIFDGVSPKNYYQFVKVEPPQIN